MKDEGDFQKFFFFFRSQEIVLFVLVLNGRLQLRFELFRFDQVADGEKMKTVETE